MGISFTKSTLNYPQGADTPIKRVRVARSPLTTDYKNFTPGDEWLDTNSRDWWKLVDVVQNAATWVRIGGTPGEVATLTGDTGGAIGPDTNHNINVLGTTGQINVTGNSGTNTLTLSLANGSTPIDSITTNVGGPVAPNGSGSILANASTSTYTDGATANTLKTEVQGTNHAVFIGKGASTPATTIAVGADHSILMGNTGADPAFTTTGIPYVAGISFDSGTNVLQRFIDTSSFTPVIEGSSSPGVGTYSIQSGRYTVFGNWVFYNINIQWSAHTGTGDMLVSGFPFIFAAAQSFYPGTCMTQNITLPASALWVVVSGVNNSTRAAVDACLDNASITAVAMDGAGSLFINGFYPTS